MYEAVADIVKGQAGVRRVTVNGGGSGEGSNAVGGDLGIITTSTNEVVGVALSGVDLSAV
jgi:hypothetical protein